MTASPDVSQPYYDLGTFQRSVETATPQAQVWFDRGLVWAYAFNHAEAVNCFERALTIDAGLAIARWGIAYAIGPNYNKAWDAFDPVDRTASLARARMELRLAAECRATAAEKGLIDALSTRFPTEDPDDLDALAAGHHAYAGAMAELAAAYPEDTDIQALAADALVNVTAWALWDTSTGAPAPDSRVVEAQRILEDALATEAGTVHPGVLHSTCTQWRCRHIRRWRCPPQTCCVISFPTPDTCSTCPPISTCCAATTAPRSNRISRPCAPTASSWNAKGR